MVSCDLQLFLMSKGDSHELAQIIILSYCELLLVGVSGSEQSTVLHMPSSYLVLPLLFSRTLVCCALAITSSPVPWFPCLISCLFDGFFQVLSFL